MYSNQELWLIHFAIQLEQQQTLRECLNIQLKQQQYTTLRGHLNIQLELQVYPQFE